MMKVLLIGGSGLISTAVTQLAIKKSIDLYVLNRGNHNENIPKEATLIQADINDEATVKERIKNHRFDAVVDWIAFNKKQIAQHVGLFKNITKQYVFISTASAYQKPLPKLPITEAIPLNNPYWKYSQNKADCEAYLKSLATTDFKVTIVRPSHTYNDQSIVFQVQLWDHPYTLIKRIQDKKPIVIPNDGNTRWTLTHHQDFAQGFLDLLGNEQAYNETFHLTSEKVYTWNQLALAFYEALNETPNIIYMPSETIINTFPSLKGPLMGDMLHDSIYDNRKIKAIAKNYTSKIAYTDVIHKALAYYFTHPDKQTVNEDFLTRYDAMIEQYFKMR